MAYLSVEQIQQLVPLRLALEDAVRRAETAGPYRRGAATVALDAVIERTAALILVTTGRQLPRNGNFDEILSGVIDELGTAWRGKSTLPAVRAQRRARNAAQHEALEPAAEYLPQWARATDSFVRSTIDAAFEIEIHTVTLSDAINDEALRVLLAEAENTLAAGDSPQAVRCAMRAYKDALHAWRQLKKAPARSPFTNDVLDKDMLARVWALEATAEASVFVANPGEAEWFARALTEGESQAGHEYFDLEDARRVIAFVFAWIVEFEQSSAAWVDNRALRHAIASRRVRSGGGPAHVVGRRIRTSSSNLEVTFEIADVPNAEQFDAWTARMDRTLNTDRSIGYWHFRPDGTIARVLFAADSDVVGEDVRRLVEALSTVDEAVSAASTKARLAADEMEATVAEHREVLSHEHYPNWVEDVGWFVDRTTNEPAWVITLRSGLAPLQVREWVLDQPGVSAAYGLGGGRKLAIGPATTPQGLREILEAADPRIQDALVEARTHEKERVALEEAVTAAVDAALRE